MRLLLIAIMLTVTGSSFAQSPASPDSLYIVTYTTGDAWDQSKKPNEQSHFKEHGARLGQLRKDGVIRFGARYAEKGIIVIAAASYSAAKEIIQADVAVLNVFYEGCVEKKR
jgi:hypothetical protein